MIVRLTSSSISLSVLLLMSSWQNSMTCFSKEVKVNHFKDGRHLPALRYEGNKEENDHELSLLEPIVIMKQNRQLQQVSQEQGEMLGLINDDRISLGIAPLCLNAKLNAAAQAHSDDMKSEVFFSHTGSNGSEFFNRIDLQNYSRSIAGENIATYPTISEAHQGLMNSQGHRDNILSPDYEQIGIGIETYSSGGFVGNLVITQVFATSTDQNEPCIDSGINGNVSPPATSCQDN
jgi:uncharacterized protein YkwD